MSTLLICPANRPAVAHLAHGIPLAITPLLGQGLLEYWLAHLAGRGEKPVLVLTHESLQQISATVGNGARWGLEIKVIQESRELTPAQALLKYAEQLGTTTSSEIATLDHFPGCPDQPLFSSYRDFYASLISQIGKTITPDRVGIREIQPGVFRGMGAYVSPGVELIAPCWIGQHVYVGQGARLGPNTIVESGAFIEADADISGTYVGQDTFVGRGASLANALALGSTLIDWASDIATLVPDPFLLCSLRAPVRRNETGWMTRLTEMYSRSKSEIAMACRQLLMGKES